MGSDDLIIRSYFNGNTTCRFPQRCLLENKLLIGLLPIFPPPQPLNQEKDGEIFHTLRVIFLTDCDCVGRDPAAISSHGSSTVEARWSSARRAQTTNPTVNAAHYCLARISHCKTQWALTAFRWRSTGVDGFFLNTDVFPQVLLVIFLLSAPDDVALLSF